MSDKKLYLIDGSGFIFRAYHALPPLTRSDGTPVGAVVGFMNMLLSLLSEHKVEKFLVVFDKGRHTFRNDLYPLYKANRGETPEDLIPQFSIIREGCRTLNLKMDEVEGFEADDVIASYAKKAKEEGYEVVVVSSDKDLMQIVDDKVYLFDHMRNRYICAPEVEVKFGLGPSFVVDIQALAGDSSDNIPGAPGIGVKTAAQLLSEYKTLENLLEEAEAIKQPKRRAALTENKDQILLSKTLVTLRKDVLLNFKIEELGVQKIDIEKAEEFFQKNELRNLRNRLIKEFNGHVEDASQKRQSFASNKKYEVISEKDYRAILNKEELQKVIELIKQKGVVAIDTETTSLDAMSAKLVGISLSVKEGQAWYVPILKEGPSFRSDLFSALSPKGEGVPLEVVQRLLGPTLKDDAILKVGHNFKYDLLVLQQHGFEVNTYEDSMLLSYLLSEGRHGLDELCLKHFDHKMISFKDLCGSGKNQMTFDEVPLEKATEYACEDADYTLRLYRHLRSSLVPNHLSAVYERLERSLIPVLAGMEKEGVLIDEKFLKNLSVSFEGRLSSLEEEIYELAGEKFLIGSPKQLGEIIFDKLGIKGGKRGKSGAYATGADVLEDLAHEGHLLPNKILEWRQIAKLKSTYSDALPTQINPFTGRVHTSFAMAVTSTGRLSSSDPNLQNIPIRTAEGREIRKAFIAEEGNVLLSLDYSQIELRLLTLFADVPTLREAFEKNIDIHTLTASQVFGIPFENITKEQRRRAKAINFGIIYGISAHGLAKQLGTSRSEASEYIKLYKEQYPGIQEYMDKTISFARHHGYVKTISGRRCYLSNINSKNGSLRMFAERQAINAPLQGSNADIIKKAMIAIPSVLLKERLSAKMILQVHDELIFECPSQEAEKTGEILQETMKKSYPLPIPIKVEIGVGDNWSEAH